MAKLDIRVGDVVRLVDFEITEVSGGGFVGDFLTTNGKAYAFPERFAAKIISRAETDAEKIARLEAENAGLRDDVKAAEQAFEAKNKSPSKIEWFGGPRPISPDARAIVWSRNGETRLVWAMGCRWDHDQSAHDIIAYMVLPS
jgi:hypothetical protein